MEAYKKEILLVDQLLKGFSQIMLQENRWTGLLFIIGLFVGNWQCGVAGILAATTGTTVARLFKYKAEEINRGLYGFSPALVGVALAFLFEATALIWVCIILGGALAALLQHFFIKRKVPAFTFPFIVVVWVLVFVIQQYTETPPSETIQSVFESSPYQPYASLTNGFGQVIFQGSVLSGIIFLIAVLISKPTAALYGLAASLLGAALSFVHGQPADQVYMGLFGFNTVLTAIAFSGTKKIDGVWVLIGSVITIAIHNLLIDFHVLNIVGGVFTFPFVAGMWLTLLIQKLVGQSKRV